MISRVRCATQPRIRPGTRDNRHVYNNGLLIYVDEGHFESTDRGLLQTVSK